MGSFSIPLNVHLVTQKYRKVVEDDGVGSSSLCVIMCVCSYIVVEFAGIYNGVGLKEDFIYRNPTPLVYV